MQKFFYLFICLYFMACADRDNEKKELSGPHAVIQLFITNSFSTSVAPDNDSLHIFQIPKGKSINDFYAVLLQSDTLIKKTLIITGRKGTATEIESVRENLKFSTIENTDILQIELYFEEEKFACAFLDSLIETFNLDVMTRLYDESQRKVRLIEAQIDSVAVKLHESEELIREDNQILNLERESAEYFEGYIKLETKKKSLKKLKDCLNRDFQVCVEEVIYGGFEDDEFLSTTLRKLYNLNVQKNNQQCPTAGNESCKKLDKEINEHLSNLDIYLKNVLSAIDAQLKQFEDYMKKLPKTEREVTREFDVNQKLYMFLLEKKTEMIIGMAGIISPIRLVDRARWERK